MTAVPGGPPRIEGRLTIVFAVACGLMVANLYYAQALIGEIAPVLGLHGQTAVLAVTLPSSATAPACC